MTENINNNQCPKKLEVFTQTNVDMVTLKIDDIRTKWCVSVNVYVCYLSCFS